MSLSLHAMRIPMHILICSTRFKNASTTASRHFDDIFQPLGNHRDQLSMTCANPPLLLPIPLSPIRPLAMPSPQQPEPNDDRRRSQDPTPIVVRGLVWSRVSKLADDAKAHQNPWLLCLEIILFGSWISLCDEFMCVLRPVS